MPIDIHFKMNSDANGKNPGWDCIWWIHSRS